jgi:nucleoside-diphosphate-sugar epimerase
MANFTILGASGFVGGQLASRLSAKGHEVLRPSRGELKSLSGYNLGHVFYCLGTDNTKADPYEGLKSHVGYLAELLRSSAFSSLTYLSSTRLYLGARCSREDSDLSILQDDDNGIFNAMKIAAEQLCLSDKNPTIRAVRLSTVIGFAPRGISLLPTLIRDALSGGKMRLTISPQSSRDYVAIDDVLDLLPRIALEGKWRCYNLASGLNIPLGEIVAVIERELSSVGEWQPNAPTVVYPIINTDRISSEFSFTPRSSLEALVSACSDFRVHFRSPAKSHYGQAEQQIS